MNKIFFSAVIFIILISCSKNSGNVYNKGLIGTWQLTEYYYSIGGPGEWHPAEQSPVHTVTFKSDGSFITSDGSFNSATKYLIKDSMTLHLINPTAMDTVTCYYSLQDNNSTLVLSPLGCIEGCSNKYKAVPGNL